MNLRWRKIKTAGREQEGQYFVDYFGKKESDIAYTHSVVAVDQKDKIVLKCYRINGEWVGRVNPWISSQRYTAPTRFLKDCQAATEVLYRLLKGKP